MFERGALMIYEGMSICNPFLISQIGYQQNEFVLCPDVLIRNKDRFSQVLYREIERHEIKHSFFRIFTFECYTVFIFYWATRNKEPGSGRDGLFVITGIMIPTVALSDSFTFITETAEFYIDLLERANHTPGSITNKLLEMDIEHCYCDTLWNKLQNYSSYIAKELFDAFQNRGYRQIFIEKKHEKPGLWFIKRKAVRQDNRHFHLLMTIILENTFSLSYTSVLMYEAKKLIEEYDFCDVCTTPNISGQTIEIFPNGSRIPFDVYEIKTCEVNQYRYIKFLRY